RRVTFQTIWMPLVRTRAFYCQLSKTTCMLSTGTVAPDLELYATPDQKLSLNDLRNKKIILAFYPAGWSPVCDHQMSLYNEKRSPERGLSRNANWLRPTE